MKTVKMHKERHLQDTSFWARKTALNMLTHLFKLSGPIWNNYLCQSVKADPLTLVLICEIVENRQDSKTV